MDRTYDGICGGICVNCRTIIVLLVSDPDKVYTAREPLCPTVRLDGFSCGSPMAELEIKDLNTIIESYWRVNLAPDRGEDSK